MRFIYQETNQELLKKILFIKDLESIFQELMTHLQGDVDRILKTMQELQQKGYIDESFNLRDFEDHLREKGIIRSFENQKGNDEKVDSKKYPHYQLSKSGQIHLRDHVFRQVFSTLKRKGGMGEHTLPYSGNFGFENTESKRPFQFGDAVNEVNFIESFKNTILRSGKFHLDLEESDLEVMEKNMAVDMAIVLLIDISHSMILYGEDRITTAKKLALALVHLITTRFPKDDLSVVLFGDDAVKVPLSDIHKIDVGPYHTNTQMGLRTARGILLKKKQINKQIIMITDGKPSMIKLSDGRYYKNSFGLDSEIVNRTLDEGILCRKKNIQTTTFMIADDPSLKQFINKFTKVCRGKAFYSNLDNLGQLVIENFLENKKKFLRR